MVTQLCSAMSYCTPRIYKLFVYTCNCHEIQCTALTIHIASLSSLVLTYKNSGDLIHQVSKVNKKVIVGLNPIKVLSKGLML